MHTWYILYTINKLYTFDRVDIILLGSNDILQRQP